MKYLKEKDVIDVLPKLKVKEVLKSAFLGLDSGSTTQPPQVITELPDGNGDCMFYPGMIASEEIFGVKMSPYLVSRTKAGK